MPAKSEKQRKLFGLALSVKRGDTPRSKVSKEVLDIVDSMSEDKIKDFASKNESHIKKFEQFNLKEQYNNNDMDFIPFHEAMEQYVIGQSISNVVSYPPFGDYSKPDNQRFYGEGLLLSNGYMYLHYGGGASGEDYNIQFIISPDNTIISKNEY